MTAQYSPVTRLEPCPFCGGRAKIREAGGLFKVWCSNSDCDVIVETRFPDKEACVAHWNYRKPVDAQQPSRFAIAQIICCGGKCILEDTDDGCILNNSEHDGDLKKADKIIAALAPGNGAVEAPTEASPDDIKDALTHSWAKVADNAGAVEADSEIEQLRRGQEIAVMPLIGPLLDQWEGISNDAKSALRWENPSLCEYLDKISDAMDATPSPAVSSTERGSSDV